MQARNVSSLRPTVDDIIEVGGSFGFSLSTDDEGAADGILAGGKAYGGPTGDYGRPLNPHDPAHMTGRGLELSCGRIRGDRLFLRSVLRRSSDLPSAAAG